MAPTLFPTMAQCRPLNSNTPSLVLLMVYWELSMNCQTASISRAKVRASSASESSMCSVWVRMSKKVKAAVAATNTAVSTSTHITRKLTFRAFTSASPRRTAAGIAPACPIVTPFGRDGR